MITTMTDSKLKTIDKSIEYIDIQGQYLQLAAPVLLSGQVNITQFLADNGIAKSVAQPTVQIGIDEAGRGPLLGSVSVAAAILPRAWSGLIEEQPLLDTPLSQLTDSKQLSEKKRDSLYPLVQHYALGYVVADIPAAVIDQINILQATMLGMRLCSETLLIAIVEQGFSEPVQLLFDGNRCPEMDYAALNELGLSVADIDCQAWVKGDARHTSIAAASVLAKVSRDRTMYALDALHPEYGIGKHKGYPTRAHMAAIESHGVLDEHRRSFAPVRRALK